FVYTAVMQDRVAWRIMSPVLSGVSRRIVASGNSGWWPGVSGRSGGS
ncbi:unnamed protein product, partial [marine sediment metagenome]